MTDNKFNDHDRPGFYEIRVKGHLTERWITYFEELTITLEKDGSTLLTGAVVDQSALFGLLSRVRNLGLPLLSVIYTSPDPTDCKDDE